MKKRYPFKFLDAYTQADRAIFFGRDAEIQQLYEMIFQTDLLLVYGASGTGKTSLLQCGLASRFQSHDWLPITVRRGSNLNESFAKALEQIGGAAQEHWEFEENAKPLSPLAQSIKGIYLNYFRPIYLIFDQFEELYILGSKDEQAEFIQTVQEILTVDQPVKLLFSIREEYLGHLYEFEKNIPELLQKKLRIEAMNLEKVRTVLEGINRLENGQVHLEKGKEKEIAELIFEKIRAKDKSLTIQLPYLQVFLDKLYLRIAQDENRQADALFTLTELEKMGDIGNVLQDFLEEQALEIAKILPCPIETVWQILSPFVTIDGTKEPLNLNQLSQKLPEQDQIFLKNAVKTFIDRRILRFLEHNELYEIAHDSLAKQIASKRTDEEIAILEIQRLIKTQSEAKNEVKEFFTEKQLNFIEMYLPKLVLNESETAWIERSKEHIERTQAAEKLRQQKELVEAKARADQEANLRSEAEQSEYKSRRNAKISIGVAFFAFFLAILAGMFFLEARQKQAVAQELLQENMIKDSLNQVEKYSRLIAEGKNFETAKNYLKAAERYEFAKEFAHDTTEINLLIGTCRFEDYMVKAQRLSGSGNFPQSILTYDSARLLNVKTDILRNHLVRLRNSLELRSKENKFFGDALSFFDTREQQKFNSKSQQWHVLVAEIQVILDKLPEKSDL